MRKIEQRTTARKHSESPVQKVSPTGADQARLISTIRAHISRGDRAAEKSEQHYIAAGQYLATLKSGTCSWAEWEEALEKVCISTGRASELMQIADGRKTLEQVRANTNSRKIEYRKVPSFRNEENEPAEVTNEAKVEALVRRAEHARRGARFDGAPTQEAIRAVQSVIGAWTELLAGMEAVGDGRCSWVEDDGGRGRAGFGGAAGDCVARAIAIATQKDYREVHDALIVRSVESAKHDNSAHGKRIRRRGGVTAFDADHGCSKTAYGPYLESLGWRHVSTEDQKLRLRADELPPGRLVVEISRHLVAVIDGVIHDTFDSGRAGRVRVKGYWRAAL